MESSAVTFLEYLFSFENPFKKQMATMAPIYKFHRLYEDRRSRSDEQRQSQLSVENEEKTGFYTLNPFFVSLLETHSLWFAPSSQFNDPWDAGGAVSILGANGAIEASIFKLLFSEEQFAHIAILPPQDKFNLLEEKLRDVFNMLLFTCFTERCDSNPMWAHYADNHKGVCLEFQFLRPLPGGMGVTYMMDAAFSGFYPVRYSDDFTRVPEINDIRSAIQILQTKHPDWAYEREVRFIKLGDPDCPGRGRMVSFSKRSLTKVILGCKVPRPIWGAIDIMLDHFGYNRTDLLCSEFDYRKQSLRFPYLKRNGVRALRCSNSDTSLQPKV